MTAKADFGVVGAGIVGCLAAWELARRGHRVTVHEAEQIGAGASGGLGSRGVRANGRDPRELAVAAEALGMWPQLGETLGAGIGWHQTGHLLLTERPDDRDELVDIAERQSDAGIETTVVEGTELKALEPGLAPEVLAAAWCPGDGVAAHTATTQIVAAAATEAGVEFRLKNPVSSLDAIDAVDGILIAANQGTAELLRLIDRALPLFPVWPQVVMAEAEGRSPQTLIGHVHRRLVVKRMDAHTVMITGGRLGAVQPDGSVGVEPSEIAATLGDASSVFPELVDATVTVAVADRSESVTPDLVPIVDRIEHDPPVWIATGWSGHGFALAPAVARSIASWMSDGERPGPLAPFSVERFD